MTQRRTGLFWALFAAILAMLLCSVGAAEGEERKLVLDDLPDTITLCLADEQEGVLSVKSTGSIGVHVQFSDLTVIDDVAFAFICTDPERDVLNVIEKNTQTSYENRYWNMDITYSPAKVGTCVYTVTASVPGTDYTLSKNITFIVVGSISDLPTLEINREYFDDNNVYTKELIMPEDGSALILELSEEAAPSYTLNGSKKFLTNESGYWQRIRLPFNKAGKTRLRHWLKRAQYTLRKAQAFVN